MTDEPTDIHEPVAQVPEGDATQALDLTELNEFENEANEDFADVEVDDDVLATREVAEALESVDAVENTPDLSWETQKALAPKTHGWTYPGVFILTGLAMAVVMGSDALITGEVGMISNIGLLVLSTIAATQVRTIDYTAAIWSPPLAWVFALITGGQFGLTMSGSLLRKEIFHFGYGLANHALWILGSVVLSAGIAIVRHGRRS